MKSHGVTKEQENLYHNINVNMILYYFTPKHLNGYLILKKLELLLEKNKRKNLVVKILMDIIKNINMQTVKLTENIF